MDGDGPVDVRDLKQCRMRTVLHMKMQGGSCLVSECIEYPRLRKMKRRSGNEVDVRITVDGLEVVGWQAIVDALNRPREENERMADDADKAALAGGKRKWKLDDGIAELEHIEQERSRTYPTHIARGALTEAEANQHSAALAGTLTLLRFCKKHEEALRTFMKARASPPAPAAESKQGDLL